MNKGELTDRIVEDLPDIKRKDVEAVLNKAIAIIQDTVAGGEAVAIANFITLKPAARAERVGRNPQTGEQMTIPATTVVKCVVGQLFKEMVANGKG